VIEKIVSGGQTGADRAAWDVALALGIEIGGWVPLGRLAEDGRIPDRYPGLRECDSEAYEIRTERNVRDSDATLVLAFGPPLGGTALTERFARSHHKPRFRVDLSRSSPEECATRVRQWLAREGPRTLNVSGPRLSEEPRIVRAVSKVLRRALADDAA
jgi:hypothetical protein